MDSHQEDKEINPGTSAQNQQIDDLLRSMESLLTNLTPHTTHKSTSDQNKRYDSTTTQNPYEEPEIDENTEKIISELQHISTQIESLTLKEKFHTLAIKGSKPYLINYSKELNPAQLMAVQYTESPLLVIAGAGSGKTRVITYKVAWLIENGIPAERILLLTFTKKAAKEMMQRVQQLLAGKSIGKVQGGTFHAYANKVIRQYGRLIGIEPNFSIIDSEDSADIIDLIKSEMKITSKKGAQPLPKKSKIQEIFSKATNMQKNIDYVIEKYYPDCQDYMTELKAIHLGFIQYKAVGRLLDYDDLLVQLKEGLATHESFKKSLLKSFDYILVDEFQDTNIIQAEIVHHLDSGKGKLTVVGDDTQSIYSFRGANYENILRFPQHYPNAKVVKIEHNYRSDQTILNFANQVVSKNKLGFKKKMKSTFKGGSKPKLMRFPDETSEAEFIVDTIVQGLEGGLNFHHFAILCRAAWHSAFIQAEFAKRNIPFVVVGGIKFSERRHVKDVLAFLKVSINLYDAVAWHRLLQLIDGVGKVRAKEIIDQIRTKNQLQAVEVFKGKKFYNSLKSLIGIFEDVTNPSLSPATICQKFYAYYKPILKQQEDDFPARERDLDILISIAEKYEKLDQFIADFTLDPPSNSYQDRAVPNDEVSDSVVTISTVHSAKGLEWHTVFIPFMIDGLFPSSRVIGNFFDLEEERRLFYVAVSRAMKQLYLTRPAYVSSWDKFFTLDSRFIHQISEKFYN